MIVGIIPAAGKGARLRPITDFIPKELLLYGSKPFLGHCIDALRDAGVGGAVIVVGQQKGVLMDYAKDGKKFGVDISYSYQVEPKGLGDAVLCAESKVGDAEAVFVLLGDDVVKPSAELRELRELYASKKPFGVILVEERDDPSKFGVVRMRDFNGKVGIVEEFFEKPDEVERKRFETNGKYHVICGAYVLSKGIFGYIRGTPAGKNGELQLTDALQRAVKDGERILAFRLSGKRVEIGTPENYLMEQYKFFKDKSEKDIEKLAKEWG
ncbi:MAG TPA: nucleotidyltransferase family protein [Candidatus Bilamarchaeaceae archaeon]|nr:nucleotidyltransferase family protein [Candidatus Bilamarchaeaceae archaeon]